MRQALSRFLVLLAVWGLPPALGAAPQTELKQLRQEIKALQEELEASEETQTDVLDKLRESEQAISEVNRHLRELAQQQRVLETSIKALQGESKQLEKDILKAQTALGKVLYQQYLYGEQDYLKILLSQTNPNERARELRYYTYISRARADLIKRLGEQLRRLEAITAEALNKKTELDANRQAEAKEKQRLVETKRQHLSVLAELKQDIDNRRGQIARLQKDEQRLQKLVARLANVVKKPRRSAAESSQANRLFYAQKGRLPVPINGELVNRFGTPREDSGAPWKGLFYKAAIGARVMAVAAGQVVFADWLRGFGNLMIVDHGEGYMSLYGNNETLYKQVGEAVGPNEAIATAGNSGGNPESGLYFELRFQSKPLNPAEWLRNK